jgi:hypothetical protein
MNNRQTGQNMKLRFEVNQAEAFRRGIDCPTSVVMIEVDPSKLEQGPRNILARHLRGIDVVEMDAFEDGASIATTQRIIADDPTLDALMLAVMRNDSRIYQQHPNALRNNPEKAAAPALSQS